MQDSARSHSGTWSAFAHATATTMLCIVATLLGHAADSPTLSHFPPLSGPDQEEPVLTVSAKVPRTFWSCSSRSSPESFFFIFLTRPKMRAWRGCHDCDCTYPYSPYPDLSTPIPSHQNHFRAPNAKPEPSGSIPSQLASNALPNTLTPLRLADAFPTRRTFDLSSSLRQVDS